jgi:signal transduction histidine kinase
MGTNLELALGDIERADAPYVEAARRAVDRMARTVDDLAGHGQLAVAPGGGPLDLAGCAREAVSDHLGPARERGVDVVAVGSRPLLVTSADDGAVKGVLGNLLSNAVRVAPKGSAVEVDWGLHEGWAWVAVCDDGPGLAPHLHARVFERGWQGQHDRDRGGAGGLGLTIARQLAEAQGGEVVVDSEEGAGATFALWLPAVPEADRFEVVAADGVHPLVRPWKSGAAMVFGSF